MAETATMAEKRYLSVSNDSINAELLLLRTEVKSISELVGSLREEFKTIKAAAAQISTKRKEALYSLEETQDGDI